MQWGLVELKCWALAEVCALLISLCSSIVSWGPKRRSFIVKVKMREKAEHIWVEFTQTNNKSRTFKKQTTVQRLWTRAESGAVVERFCQLDPSEHVWISLYGSVRTSSCLSRVKKKWHFLIRRTRGSKVTEHGSILLGNTKLAQCGQHQNPKYQTVLDRRSGCFILDLNQNALNLAGCLYKCQFN